MKVPAIRERTLVLPGLGLSTRLIEAGEGPPVVLLHGNPDCAEEWSALIARLLATEAVAAAIEAP